MRGMARLVWCKRSEEEADAGGAERLVESERVMMTAIENGAGSSYVRAVARRHRRRHPRRNACSGGGVWSVCARHPDTVCSRGRTDVTVTGTVAMDANVE